MRILLVDDERSFSAALKAILEKNRYTVECAYDGLEALSFLETETFDVILLDVMMPHLDGYQLLSKIRGAGNNTPVIFLSAKGETEDRIKGLELGGDDYLPKPFSSKELLARLKVILRRSSSLSLTHSYEGLTLDEKDFSLAYQGQKESLSNKEYQLMELFLSSPDRLFPAERLLNEAWNIDSSGDISSLWVFLSSLRKKLKALKAPFHIKSVRGLGYRLEKDV